MVDDFVQDRFYMAVSMGVCFSNGGGKCFLNHTVVYVIVHGRVFMFWILSALFPMLLVHILLCISIPY